MMTRSVYPRSQSMLGEPPSAAPPRTKTIPFDYVFQFTLLGQRGNKVQDVVEISTEGIFVALSVGYSLVIDELKTPRTFGPVIESSEIELTSTTSRPLAEITLGEIAAGLEKIGADLTVGFRLNPASANLLDSGLPLDTLSEGALNRVFETGRDTAEEVSFLYTLDVGNTGREYQNKPNHNIAGLGIANGHSPFAPLH